MTEPDLSSIPGVETFTMLPDGFDCRLRISIARPTAPANDSQASAPSVVYVTDADFSLGTVVEAARMGHLAGELGPATIVGIGYAEETGDYRFTNLRRGLDFYRGPRRDLDLPGVGTQRLGGAGSFLTAVLDTIVPEVERRVPDTAGARRILFGVSAGGHFATYTLIERPDAFQGFALMSPALIDFPPAPGDEQLVEAIRDLPPGAIRPGTAVFLSAGGREEEPGEAPAEASIISNLYRMRAALDAQGASTELVVLPGETHFSVLGAAVSRALRFLVPRRVH